MTIRWVNHVVISAPRNGTTTHTVDPAGGTVVGGASFTPTAGRLLVCVVNGPVTSTTPSGWTLPTNGSAVSQTGLYVFHKTAAGADTISTTHNGSNYPVFFEFFEFPAGSTFKGSAGTWGVINGGAGPTLSGMTGTTQYFAAIGSGIGIGAAQTTVWSAGTELTDVSVPYGGISDGVSYSLAYLDDSTATSWSSAATNSPDYGYTFERLVFGVGVPILLGEWGFLDNLNDTSGNGRHGTASGSLTYVTGPQTNTKGVKFGSTTSSVSFGRTGLEPSLEGITVMAWVRLEGAPGSDIFLHAMAKARASNSSRSRIGIAYTASGGVRRRAAVARWKDALDVSDAGASWTDTGWHHVAIVDGNTRFAYYTDGTPEASTARALGAGANTAWEDFPWRTGYVTEFPSDPVTSTNFSVSGIRIFQGELTTAEINTWMNTPIVPAVTNTGGMFFAA